MPVMDEFKDERERIKNASFKEKLKYFWCYYKWHTIVTIAVIFFVGLTIHDVTTQKEDAFFAAMLNCASPSEEVTAEFTTNFADYAGIDMKEYDVLMDNSINFSENTTVMTEYTMSASQKLLVYTAAGELDIIVGGSDIFPDEANQGMFHDLRDILSEEQLEKYEPYFYYVDQAYLDAVDEYEENYTEDAVLPEAPDPSKPEEMEDPIPVALFVTDSKAMEGIYYFSGDYTAVGVMVNSPHPEAAVTFIDYLFEE